MDVPDESVKPRSLSFRLYLLIIPTTILAISLLGYLDDHVSARMLDRQVEDSSVLIATELAEDLGRNAMEINDETTRRFLGGLVEANVFITRIEVYRLVGNDLVRIVTTSTSSAQPIQVDELTAVRQSRSLVVHQFHEGERLVKVIVPISAGGAPRGCVALTSSLRHSDLIKEVHYKIALFLIPGAVVTIILMLHVLFTRVVTRRIDRLVASMARARAGDLRERAQVDARDEIGTIARGFNGMMDEIERTSLQRDRLLEEQRTFNTQLQDKIAEATRELSTANERLRSLNEALLEAQRRLTQSERTALAGYMAATFAHEIGSPLSAMSTHLQLMAEDRGITADTRRRIDLVQEQLARITGFVEELLSETRVSAQSRIPVQVNEILSQLLLFLEQHMARCNVRIDPHLDPELPPINANPQQLQQVFLNLLNNACDAMPGGGKVVVTTQADNARPGPAYVTVCISDTGVGIPPEKQARIFEPFFSTKDLRGGTGLGLTIAAKIIRQHQGSIELTSAPNQGASFTIRFPVSSIAPEGPKRETVRKGGD